MESSETSLKWHQKSQNRMKHYNFKCLLLNKCDCIENLINQIDYKYNRINYLCVNL